MPPRRGYRRSSPVRRIGNELRTRRVSRRDLLAGTPFVSGAGFLCSCLIAVALGAPIPTGLWGMIVALACATLGTIVLTVTEPEPGLSRQRTSEPAMSPRTVVVVLGGALLLGIATGALF